LPSKNTIFLPLLSKNTIFLPLPSRKHYILTFVFQKTLYSCLPENTIFLPLPAKNTTFKSEKHIPNLFWKQMVYSTEILQRLFEHVTEIAAVHKYLSGILGDIFACNWKCRRKYKNDVALAFCPKELVKVGCGKKKNSATNSENYLETAQK
jgi:hypothetical protein